MYSGKNLDLNFHKKVNLPFCSAGDQKNLDILNAIHEPSEYWVFFQVNVSEVVGEEKR